MNAGFLMMNRQDGRRVRIGGYVRENGRLVNRVWREWRGWGMFVSTERHSPITTGLRPVLTNVAPSGFEIVYNYRPYFPNETKTKSPKGAT